ncbi:MAG: OmpA family protein [Candidatus Omnitrophica bacterium]|nr:OmpA family protein [Candidatus Omnitrophota bacterium]
MVRKKEIIVAVCIMFVLLGITGCAGNKELQRINKEQVSLIAGLNEEIAYLNNELDMLSRSKENLSKTQLLLQNRLKKELAKGDLTVEMEDKGLVVTVLNKILFDSGKTKLKGGAQSTLNKVGSILRTQVPDQIIYIEGHTDSDPIKRSGFKSNWELSTARATEVVHYFIDKSGIEPQRVVAAGYGEFHPVASNTTGEGKSQNRRVEIVISPKQFIKKPFVKQADEENEQEDIQ